MAATNLPKDIPSTLDFTEEMTSSLHGAFALKDNRYACTAVITPTPMYPYIDQLPNSDAKPAFPDQMSEFVTQHPNIQNQLQNKVRKCPDCGKPNAYTLANCNGCGRSFEGVDISYTNNIFSGFVYGIQKGPFPFTISMRHQTDSIMVFDDLLALTQCHLNCVPSSHYFPDWLALMKQPVKGLALIQEMWQNCFNVTKDMFLKHPEWSSKVFAPSFLKQNENDLASALATRICAGFNYPPSQYQLHLQFMLPPFLPYQYLLYLKGIHFTYKRFFPFEYVVKVLECQAKEPLTLTEKTSVEEVMDYFKSKGIDYDVIHKKFYDNAGKVHCELSNWRKDQFDGYLVVSPSCKDGIVFKPSKDSATKYEAQTPSEDSKQPVHAQDKNILQNYGRPYVNGRPSGQYYKYARKEAMPEKF